VVPSPYRHPFVIAIELAKRSWSHSRVLANSILGAGHTLAFPSRFLH
jgi:hypothetical protein